MTSDAAPRLSVWQQTWRLSSAAALGVPLWLLTGVLLAQEETTEGRFWFTIGDPLVALGCLTALLWRRRFPLTITVAVTIAAATSALAAGAALLALCSISTRRRPVEIGIVALASVVAAQFASGLYPIEDQNSPLWLEVAIPALIAGITVAVGVAIGARRVELRSLRDRAETTEREQVARAAQARALERNRIAREMHDVLAHRISLVAMQAGALQHRDDLSAEENRVLIGGIADGSHQALEELRDVLGVLRAGADRSETPQPSLDLIPDLVSDARGSGVDVTLTTTVTGRPSDTAGRTCYRIVQEGLTNAAKHAPGSRVSIELAGTAGTELRILLRNSAATTAAVPPPSSGFGLLGLSERVSLAGGELDHHPTSDNGYLLTARLPWPDHEHEKRA